ncbi:TXND5-like protein [Mya arenaria]|uniref:TXND5-like protein n=1 Tax=Mya arenaria TaxID=6604 RepID=A0ABY7F2I7_MYAAR|nr:TXND5-like protein [Mya arenaria]
MIMMQKSIVSCLFLALAIVYVRTDDHGENAVDYNKESFDSAVAKERLFVMFFAPWCGHCKRLAPTWDELAAKYNVDGREVAIGKVDCTIETALCSDHGVRGYPTVKFFNLNKEGEKYAGGRTMEALTSYVQEQLGKAPVELPKDEEGLFVLTDDTFEAHVAKGHHFIKFYAPWCGHCKRMAPTWDELAKKTGIEGKVKIAKVDCTQNSQTCSKHSVRGYPTIMWFTNGEKSEDYRGGRELPSFEAFIAKMTSADVEEKKTSTDGQVPAKKAGEEEEVDAGMVSLTDEDFVESVSEDYTLVMFADDEKPSSNALIPTMDRVADEFIDRPEVLIAKVNCRTNVKTCKDQDAKGPYPQLRVYNSGAIIETYKGEKTVSAVTKYLESLIQKDKSKDEL